MSIPKGWKIYKLRKVQKTLVVVGFGLIILGLIGISLPFWGVDIAGTWQRLFVSFQEGETLIAPDALALESPDVSPDLGKIGHNEIQDRLVINKIGVNMPVILSNSEGALSIGGWMYPTTSAPDKGGNTAIFGHRFRYLPPISNTLYSLDKLVVGDQFQVIWKGQTYTYRVRETKVVEPTDVWVLNPTEDSVATLITCTPLFSTKQRLVVTGELIN